MNCTGLVNLVSWSAFVSHRCGCSVQEIRAVAARTEAVSAAACRALLKDDRGRVRGPFSLVAGASSKPRYDWEEIASTCGWTVDLCKQRVQDCEREPTSAACVCWSVGTRRWWWRQTSGWEAVAMLCRWLVADWGVCRWLIADTVTSLVSGCASLPFTQRD